MIQDIDPDAFIDSLRPTAPAEPADDVDSFIESMRQAETPLSLYDFRFRLLPDRDIDEGLAELQVRRGFAQAIRPQATDIPFAGFMFEVENAVRVQQGLARMQTGKATLDDEREVWRFMVRQAQKTTSGGTIAELLKSIVTSGAEIATGAGVAAAGGKAAARAGLGALFSKAAAEAAETAFQRRVGELAVDTGIDLSTRAMLTEAAKTVGKGAAALATTGVLQEAIPRAAGGTGGAWTAQSVTRALGSKMTDEEAQAVADEWNAAAAFLLQKGGGLIDGAIRQSIQLAAEGTGAVVGALPPFAQVNLLFGALFKRIAGEGAEAASGKVAKAMMFSQPGGEVGEEFLAAVAEAAVMGDKSIVEAALEVAEITPEMLAAFGLPGTAGAALRRARGGKMQPSAPEVLTGAGATEGGDPTQATPAAPVEGVAASSAPVVAPEAREGLASLQGALRERVGAEVEVQAVEPEGVQEQAATAFAKRRGVEVQFYERGKLPEGVDEAQLEDAYFPGAGNRIFLRRGSRDVGAVAVHEQVHVWESQQPEARRAELTAALGELVPAEVRAVSQALARTPLYRGRPQAEIESEVRAGVAQTMAGLVQMLDTAQGRQAFTDLTSRPEGALRRIASAVYDWIADRIRALPQSKRARARAFLRLARGEENRALAAQRLLDALNEIRPAEQRVDAGEQAVAEEAAPAQEAQALPAEPVAAPAAPAAQPARTKAERQAERERRKEEAKRASRPLPGDMVEVMQAMGSGGRGQVVAQPGGGPLRARVLEVLDGGERLRVRVDEDVQRAGQTRRSAAENRARRAETERVVERGRVRLIERGTPEPGSVLERRRREAERFAASLPPTIEVDGKQRPTLNSDGRPLAADEKGLRAFWRWFGDSKVVDGEGRPLVMYHGTRSDFSAFGNIGGRFRVSAGYYFTSRPNHASIYADGLANAVVQWNPKSPFAVALEDGANVRAVYLALRNPLALNASQVATDSAEQELDRNNSEVVARAQGRGHDGVIFTRALGDEYDVTVSVAFDPTQIKSATGNLGTFDPTNPDIRFAASLPPTIEVDGKQRPTLNSDGRPIAADEKGLRAFWRWFGDSIVVDDAGRPLVVYHGRLADSMRGWNNEAVDGLDEPTVDNLTVFGPRANGLAWSFFTDDADLAAEYAGTRIWRGESIPPRGGNNSSLEGGTILPVYLRLAKPLVIDAGGEHIGVARLRAMKKLGEFRRPGPAPNDGVVIENADDTATGYGRPAVANVYMTWLTDSVKSATGNLGTFDPTNPDIRFAASLPPTIEVDGKQRPTLNSDGRPIAADEKGLRAFWRWFGDSKVVDDQGRPLVVYHGTTEDFDEFGVQTTALGFFFTPDRATADYYSPDGVEKTKAVYLRVQKLADFDDDAVLRAIADDAFGGDATQDSDAVSEAEQRAYGRIAKDAYLVALLNDAARTHDPRFDPADPIIVGDEFAKESVEWYVERGSYPWVPRELTAVVEAEVARVPAVDAELEAVIEAYGSQEFYMSYQDDMMRAAQRLGYDGVVMADPSSTGDPTSYVVFDPTQIKSATGNLGTFDPTNPDIRFAASLYNSVPAFAQNTTRRYLDRFRTLFQDNTIPLRELPEVRTNVKRYRAQMPDKLRRFEDRLVAMLKPFQVGEFDDMERAVYLQAAMQRNAWLLQSKGVQDGAGISTADAQIELAQIEQRLGRPRLDALFAEHRSLNAERLAHLEEAGFITAQQVADWGTREPNWISMRDIDPDADEHIAFGVGGRSMSVRNPQIREAKGRKTELEHPLLAWASEYATRIVAAEKNKALRDAAANGIPSVPKPQNVPGGFTAPDTYVPYVEQGQQMFLETQSKEQADVLKALDGETLGLVTSMFGKVTRAWSRAVTGQNPAFWPLNFLRDSFQAASYTLTERSAAYAAKAMARSYAVLPLLLRYQLTGNAAGLPMLDAAQRAGFKTTWVGRRTLSEQLAWMRDQVEGRRGPRAKLRAVLRTLESVGDSFEMATRYAVFEAEVQRQTKAGANQAEAEQLAGDYAREITLNFDTKGSLTPHLAAFFAFFNPAVQGGARLMQVAMSARGAGFVTSLALAGFLMEALNYAVADDDERTGLNLYGSLPEYEKSRNIILPFWNGKSPLKITMPYGLDSIYGLGRRLYMLAAGKDLDPRIETKQVVWEGLLHASTAFNPLGDISDPYTMVAPTVLRPFVEIDRNRKFGDRPIMRPGESFGQTVPDSARAFENIDDRVSGWLAVRIADALNLGGPEELPTGLDVSPESVQHIIEFVAAGFGGRDLDRLSEHFLSDKPVSLATTVPVLRGFSTSVTDHYISNEYYDIAEKASRIGAMERNPANKNRLEEVRDYDRRAWELRRAVGRADRRMGELRRALRAEGVTAEKATEIREKMTEVQASIVRQYYGKQ